MKSTNKFKLALLMAIFLLGIIAYRKRQKIKAIATNTMNYIKEKTWDYHSDRRIAKLHPLVRAKAKEFIIRAERELGIKLRVSSGYRSWAEQRSLYNQGRTAKGKIITNAQAGQSYHNYGLAIDVVEIKNGKAIWNNPNWNRIAELGKSIGFEWGGDWRSIKDKPHFQMSFGKHHTELAQLYKTGQRNGEYVNIA